MFARLSAVVLLALPLLALADCETKNQQCCNSVQDAQHASSAAVLGNLIGAAAQGITGQVGCMLLSLL
ncbi:hypothetical protein H0H87_011297 [Tephrocybe sp. NHM501043]|nr:hypothetical protein H0H87_011297 [Tephrocybe sp. NHM501043]